MGIAQITKRDGETIQLNTNEPFCFVKEATLTSSLKGDDYISLKIVSSKWLSFAKGDKITVGGKEYSIRATTTREIVSEGYYNYEPVFYGVMYDLMKTIYRNCDKYGKSDKSTFDLTYTIKEFVQVLIYNMERDYPGLWKFDVDNCPETEAKTIQFSGVNCLQALQTLCNSEQFNLEFQITQDKGIRTIHIGKFGKRINPPSGADFFEWGKGNGLYNLKEQKIDDKAIITRLWAEGGTTNIRSDYREYAERLQLPYPQRKNQYEHTLSDGTVVKVGTETIGISDDSKRYIEDAELRDKIGSEEDVKTYDDIYPTRTGTVTAVVADDICAFVDDTMDFDLNEKDDKGTKYLVNGTSAKITFTSGRLAGQQFELEAKGGYDNKTKKFRIIPFTDSRGLTIPSAETQDAYKIESGNTYKITDIYLPESYEHMAEENLWYAAMEDFKTATQAKAQYTLTLDRLYFLQELGRDTDTSVFEVGDYVPVKDTRFGIEKQMRIQKITRNLLLEQDYQITLADTTTVSIQTQTVLAVLDHENIINNNRLRDLNKARRGWRTTEDLRNMVYDTDGYFDTGNIKPNSIDTNMLTVGAKSQQFVLSGSVLQANFGGNPNMFVATAGILSHLTIDNDKIRNWQMNEASFELQNTGGYYLFAKCSKSGENGVWYLSQEQLKFEPTSDPNNYYFQVGIVSSLYADDNFRDFQTTYGFTRVNGNTITTGRIITSDGGCYLDLDGNKFRIGDSTSSIDWNVSAKSRLTLKNVSVASGGGDVAPLGVYRGAWNNDYTYYNGDEVTYGIGDCVSTYRYVYPTPASGVLPTDTEHWQVIAKGSEGKQGISPNTAFKSTVFLRSNAAPSTPTGGSYSNPVPSGWSDGIPSGEAKLWASTRIFSSDGKTPQQSAWTAPRQMTDTADFDVVFSSEDNPASPTGHPNTNAQWGDKSGDDTIWMATSRKSNGVWEDWQASRIKGENGRDGSSISIKGQAYAHYADAGDWVADREQRVVLIDKMTSTSADGEAETKYCIIKEYGRPRPGAAYGWMTLQAATGDAYIMVSDDESMNGCLYVAQADGWLNVGQIKGDKGDTGDDGKSAYLHIKYAKSLVEDDWSDNSGETPAEYIGVYADNNPADQLVWSLYSWSKWQGEDGFGYEYIYRRTSSATAPSTPTGQSQEDGFVPDGWTDDPTGVSATYMYEWVCYRKKTHGAWGAFIGSASDNTKAALWAKYGQAGAKGDYTEIRFAKNGSTTTPPLLSVNSTAPDGWTTATPSVGIGEHLWMTTAKKSAAGALLTTWSTPVRVSGIDGMKGDKGEDGSSPAMVYRGEYSASKTYYGNTFRLDCVRLGNAYYIARIDAGEFAGIAPPDSTRWNAFGASFDSVATQLLLAQYANIGNFVIKDNCIISQKGTVKGVASTDYENPDFVPSILLDGQNGQSVISGSLRSPCVRYDGAFYFGGDVSSEAERYDNLVLSVPQDEWELNLNLPWTEKCNGRRITIINYKWGSETPNGTYTFTAPDGKYFYEDGALGKTLKISREVVELLGYGDNETFFGWIVTGRCSIGTERKYGKAIKALAYGTVTGTPSGASISYKTYDGEESMGVSRMETGRYKITFPADWFGEAGDVFVMATGVGDSYGESAPIKATLAERSTSHIMVETSDDESRNDGTFMFLLMNSNDWL